MKRIFAGIIFLFFFSLSSLYCDALFEAMGDELKRSITDLKIENQENPYYISYRVEDIEYVKIRAEFGSLVYSRRRRMRDLYVDVRIGSYGFDNSNFMCEMGSSSIIESDHTNLPIDDEYDAIRKDLWLVTDGTYKRALEKLSRKQATIQNQQIKEQIEDFSKIAAQQIIEPLMTLRVDQSKWEDRIAVLSRIFRKYPKIQQSSVTFYTQAENQYFLDSEGSKSRSPEPLVYIEIAAKTQTIDGDPLEDIIAFHCHTPDELPDLKEIIRSTEAMAETLSLKTELEEVENYSGPVLFAGQAAGEFIFQLLGKGVSDPRSPLYENEMLTRGLSKDMGFLTKRFGRKVLPEFLSAYDDPQMKEWRGNPLIGFFSVDDQGTPSERTEVVKDGKLSSFLMSRTPTKKIAKTNGHGRYKGERYIDRICGMVGNLVVESHETMSSAELRKMLIGICKDFEIPYGIIVTKLEMTRPKTLRERYMDYFSMRAGGVEKPLLSSAVTAYKVDVETGKVALVRGFDFSSVTSRVLRDIVATDDTEYVYNFVYRDDNGNAYPMAVLTPSILVEEMDLEPSGKKAKKLPVLSHPYFK
jgi:TldD protein